MNGKSAPTLNLSILSPADIAYRRFLPALEKATMFRYAGVGYASPGERLGGGDAATTARSAEKAEKFRKAYGGRVWASYAETVASPFADAIYIPLPPALHYPWAERALSAGKHVFLEKPSTVCYRESEKLVALAREKGLALRENYMFTCHKQLEKIKELTDELGQIRLYRLAFGFPRRAAGDFRYHQSLGGGALLDCGGYTLRLADILLGNGARVESARLIRDDSADPASDAVDLYGSGVLANPAGVTAQVAFGMDNAYRCELEIWGSRGTLRTGRIFTAPPGFTPTAEIVTSAGARTVQLPDDDSFSASVTRFARCVENEAAREEEYRLILRQAALVDEFRAQSGIR